MRALDVAVAGLATARLTQLIVDDEITEPVREQIQGAAQSSKAWDLVDTAVNCHACSSIWAAGGVLVAREAGPVGRFLVRVLAFSQAALAVKAVIERIDR